MKGVIFNIFENFISKNLGEDAWYKVLDEARPEDEVFVGPKTYPDSTFLKLLSTCVGLYKLPLDSAVRTFGKFTFPQLVSRAPDLVAQFKTPEDLLIGLDGIIHVEVRKLMEDADPPKFVVSRREDGVLDVQYISKRKLCRLVEGLMEGLAEHYGKELHLVHKECTCQGASSCVFEISFLEKREK